MLVVRASTPLRPSEDPKKVERALHAIFPQATTAMGGGKMEVESDSLKTFRDLVWKSKILDAARRILLGSLETGGRRARFRLNKQAAFAGTVSFAVGQAPLGDIDIMVEGDDLEALFKEIAPPTLRGRPVSEEEFERYLEKRRKAKAVPRGRAPVAEVDLDAELTAIHKKPGDEDE